MPGCGRAHLVALKQNSGVADRHVDAVGDARQLRVIGRLPLETRLGRQQPGLIENG